MTLATSMAICPSQGNGKFNSYGGRSRNGKGGHFSGKFNISKGDMINNASGVGSSNFEGDFAWVLNGKGLAQPSTFDLMAPSNDFRWDWNGNAESSTFDSTPNDFPWHWNGKGLAEPSTINLTPNGESWVTDMIPAAGHPYSFPDSGGFYPTKGVPDKGVPDVAGEWDRLLKMHAQIDTEKKLILETVEELTTRQVELAQMEAVLQEREAKLVATQVFEQLDLLFRKEKELGGFSKELRSGGCEKRNLVEECVVSGKAIAQLLHTDDCELLEKKVEVSTKKEIPRPYGGGSKMMDPSYYFLVEELMKHRDNKNNGNYTKASTGSGTSSSTGSALPGVARGYL